MAGWAAYAKHRDIFKSNLAICLKRQVYSSCVLPAMAYGAETWTQSKQAQNKLAAAQTKMEISMLNITYKDRKTNIWVKGRTKVIDMMMMMMMMTMTMTMTMTTTTTMTTTKTTTTTTTMMMMMMMMMWSAVAQLVECRTRNRESPGSNPRCYRFEVWAFSFTSRRLSRLSCINEYLRQWWKCE